MENQLLAPLLETFARERCGEEVDIAAAQVVGLWLLTGPYLGQTYASYTLTQASNGSVRLMQHTHNGLVGRDPLESLYRDTYCDEEDDDNAWFLLEKTWLREQQPITSAQVPQEILGRAQALLERVRQSHPLAIARLLEPTPAQLEARQQLTLQWVDDDTLWPLLSSKLGSFHDGSLRSHGIEYHTPPHFTDKALYLVASNEDEIAGVLKLGTHRGWAYGLGYVAVAPGFRERGLSRRMFQLAIDRCAQDRQVFIRSSPGDFTLERPAITMAYDRMVLNSAILHAESNSPLLYAMEQAFKSGLDYDLALAQLKPVCDMAVPDAQARMRKQHSWERENALRDLAQQALEQIQAPKTASGGRRRMGPT